MGPIILYIYIYIYLYIYIYITYIYYLYIYIYSCVSTCHMNSWQNVEITRMPHNSNFHSATYALKLNQLFPFEGSRQL